MHVLAHIHTYVIDDDICIMSDDLEDIEKILIEKSKELNIRVEIPDDFGVVAMKVFFKPLTENGNDNIIDAYPAGEYNIDFYAHKEKTYWGKIKMVQNVLKILMKMKLKIIYYFKKMLFL